MSGTTDGALGGLVIVTADNAEHRYVANRIAEHHPVRAILICDPAPARSWYRLLRSAPTRFLDRALRRAFLRLTGDGRKRNSVLHEVLGPASVAFPDVDIRYVGQARERLLVDTVAALAPDVLAVYGTGLIPDAVLALSGKALNMHTGISPRYRGTACTFWPVYNEEPEWIGATVHECTAKVDGGQIFAVRRAALRRGDSLHHVFARAVVAGAEAYADVVGAALAGKLVGKPQDLRQGHEYRGSSLGLWSELLARRRLRRMRTQWPEA